MDESFPSIDSANLTPVVRRILSDPSATPERWQIASLGYRVINGITGGLWRVSGTARSGDNTVSWSTVLKVLQQVGAGVAANFAPTNEPSHWNYWRREALAYQSGYLADLGAGLVAPRSYGVDTPAPGSAWLWLEAIAGTPAQAWSDERWGRVGHQLGLWQGAYAAGTRPLPDATWLCRGHLQAWVPKEDALDGVQEPGVWSNPLLRDHLPPDTGERVAQLWANRPTLLAIAAQAPQTLCHLDLWSRNFLARDTPGAANALGAPGETVLLDWSMLGLGVLGEDLANLVFDSAWMLDIAVERLPGFERAVLEGYLSGLRDAGWTGDDATVRAAYGAIGALRFGLLAAPVLNLARDEAQHATLASRYGRPIAETIALRAAVVRRGLDLAHGLLTGTPPDA